jgi:hypothetical protein
MHAHHARTARAILDERTTRKDRARLLAEPVIDFETDDRPHVPHMLRAHNFQQVSTPASDRRPKGGRKLTFVESRVSNDRRWSDTTWDALAR